MYCFCKLYIYIYDIMYNDSITTTMLELEGFMQTCCVRPETLHDSGFSKGPSNLPRHLWRTEEERYLWSGGTQHTFHTVHTCTSIVCVFPIPYLILSCLALSCVQGVEGVPGQCSAGSHPGQGGQLGLSPGLDGCPQWRREAKDGCKDSPIPSTGCTGYMTHWLIYITKNTRQTIHPFSKLFILLRVVTLTADTHTSTHTKVGLHLTLMS